MQEISQMRNNTFETQFLIRISLSYNKECLFH